MDYSEPYIPSIQSIKQLPSKRISAFSNENSYHACREAMATSPVQWEPCSLVLKESAVVEMHWLDGYLLLADKMNYKGKCDLQKEAPNLSRDLWATSIIVTAFWAQPTTLLVQHCHKHNLARFCKVHNIRFDSAFNNNVTLTVVVCKYLISTAPIFTLILNTHHR